MSSFRMRAFFLVMLGGVAVSSLPVQAADERSPDWVAKRVQDWQPRPVERRFDEIGWAPSLRAALVLAKEHNRPVFLFTFDGAEMGMKGHRC